MNIKAHILQELDELNEGQLKAVDNFIASLKIRSRLPNQELNQLELMAKLYQEFSEEDRQLAEAGMTEYQELLEGDGLKPYTNKTCLRRLTPKSKIFS
jgi:hypothetical protein